MNSTTRAQPVPERPDQESVKAPRPSAEGAARVAPSNAIGIGSVLGDRYLLKRQLGAGRFAEIYLAVDQAFSSRDIKQERQVALHVVRRHVEKRLSMLKKLQQAHLEPHSWAHRSLLRVRDFGDHRGRYFFVTELLKGASLRTILDDTPEELMSEAEALAVLRAVGDGLKYAHAKGAVHGDLRPENVFITHEYAIKVLDLWPEMPTRGAPFFIEDVESSQPPDPRDDVYGLACLAYEMFAGHHPFNGNSPIEAAAAHLPLAPISRLTVQRWNAVERALALRRVERTPSVQQFLDELGIAGDERLRPPETEPSPPTLVDEVAAPPPVARHAAKPAPPLPATASVREYPREALLVPEPVIRRPERSSSGVLRTVLVLSLCLVAASAAVAYRFVPTFTVLADEWFAVARTAALDARRTLQARVDSPSRAEPRAPAAAPPAPSAAAPAVAPASPSEPPAMPAPQPGPAEAPAALDARPPQTVTPPPEAPVQAPAGTSAPSTLASEAPAAAPPPAAAVRPEALSFNATSISVTENQPGAIVELTRSGGTLGESSIVWWTTQGSALADEDYAALGARIEQFPVGSRTLRLVVPLIGDASPEPDERFYIHARSAGGSEPRRVAAPELRVEVVIRDDD